MDAASADLPGYLAALCAQDEIAHQGSARALAEVTAKRRVLARHRIDPERAGDRMWARACIGCGTAGDCDDPVTEDINNCPELLDMASVYENGASS